MGKGIWIQDTLGVEVGRDCSLMDRMGRVRERQASKAIEVTVYQSLVLCPSPIPGALGISSYLSPYPKLPQLSEWLKTIHIYSFPVSMGQESRYGLSGVSLAQGSSQNPATKMVARAVVSSEGSAGEDPLLAGFSPSPAVGRRPPSVPRRGGLFTRWHWLPGEAPVSL